MESKQVNELIYTKTSLPNDRPQRSPVEFLVEWHDGLREWIIATQDDVASFLTLEVEADFLQGSYALAARNSG